MGPIAAGNPMRAGAPGLQEIQARAADRVPPGQAAKTAVEGARAAGADLPANAQGIAASSIARGADPASLFQAMLPPAPDPGPADGEGQPNPAGDGAGDGTVADPADGEGTDIAALIGPDQPLPDMDGEAADDSA